MICCKSYFSAAAFVAIGWAGMAPAETRAEDNWEYSTSLGGWLDKSTGLVWSEYSGSWPGGLNNWNSANNYYLPRLRTKTGNPAWRLPTIAELQQAHANGAVAAGVGNIVAPPDGRPWFLYLWSSDDKGRKFAWAIEWNSGTIDFWDKKSYGDAIAVYRAY